MPECVKCGTRWLGEDWACPRCEEVAVPIPGHVSDVDRRVCVACQGPMESRGPVPVRTHGPEAGWWNLWRGMEELDERIWRVQVYRCRTCHRVAFYDDTED